MMGLFDQIVSLIAGIISGSPKKRRTSRVSRRRKISTHSRHKKLKRPYPRRRTLSHKKKVPAQKTRGRKNIKPLAKGRQSIAVRQKTRSSLEQKLIYIGEVSHYFSKIMVCVVSVQGSPLKVGDRIRIKRGKEFTQTVKSLQVESREVQVARKGQLVGLKVARKVSVGAKVYRLS
jgi:translation initiation factor IF-2